MNHIEPRTVNQPKTEFTNEQTSIDLRQATKAINADYQQINWKDRLFLNRILSDAIKILEVKGENL
jgi:hypothetical protein